MKSNTYITESEIILYDDDKLEHVLAGPDYGQPWYCDDGIELDESVVEEFLLSL